MLVHLVYPIHIDARTVELQNRAQRHAHLVQHGAHWPAALAASGEGHDAEGTHVVAAAHYGEEGAVAARRAQLHTHQHAHASQKGRTPRLITQATQEVVFTRGELSNPQTVGWTRFAKRRLQPTKLKGKHSELVRTD